MDPVSCLYNFLSIGILCYFVIICFLIKKCCMNCGTNCASDDLCKCYQRIYEGEITPSNHVIVCDGDQRLPISYILNQQDNEGEYVLGDDGVLYRNEACKECCTDDISRSSCNSREDVFVIRATRGKEICAPCSPSALGLGEGSLKRTPSGRSVPASLASSHPASSYGASSHGASYRGTSPGGSYRGTSPGGSYRGTSPGGSYRGTSPGGSYHAASAKGSPQNLSVASELQGVITPGVDPYLATSKRSSPVVEFQQEPDKRVFTVEGSVGSSNISREIPGSPSSCGSRTSRGSHTSHTSRTSCGSRTSHTSRVSCGSRTSHTSHASRTSCGSRTSRTSVKSVTSKKSCLSTCPSQTSKKSSPGGVSITFADESGAQTRGSKSPSRTSPGKTSPGKISPGKTGGSPSLTSKVSKTGSKSPSFITKVSKTGSSPGSGSGSPSQTSYARSVKSAGQGQQPIYDKSGKITGYKPVEPGQPIYGPDGKISGYSLGPGQGHPIYGSDGKISGYSLGGQSQGQPIYGPDGKISGYSLAQGQPIYGPDGKISGYSLPQGQPIYGPDGKISGYSLAGQGQQPIYDKSGKITGYKPVEPGQPIYGPDGKISGYSLASKGKPGGAQVTYAPDGSVQSTSYASTVSSSTRRGRGSGVDLSDVVCDGSPSSSVRGVKKTPSVCKPISSSDGDGVCGSDSVSGKSVCSAREEYIKSKSGSCVSPCSPFGSGRGSAPRSAKKSKSGSFKSSCGSPGTPCPFKDAKSGRSASPVSGQRGLYNRGTSPIASKGGYRSGSPGSDPNKNVCSGSSVGRSKASSPCVTSRSKSETATFTTGEITPISSPSSPDQKAGTKTPCDTCSSSSRNKKGRKTSPILKSPDDSPRNTGVDGVVSPTRVSIKEKFDIITPEGIKSAPTFGKDVCDPCPFLDSENTSAGGEMGVNGRRNNALSDEYKDNISNKRRADNISADYKDSADNSRGTKSARFSDRCNTNSCSRVSSSRASSKSCSKCSKGKSWPSTSSAPSKSATSSAVTTNASTKCSKCSTKYSSDSQLSSATNSTKTKPSATSSCPISCKKSGQSSYLNSPKSNYQTESVTTADIDDFRAISPNNSRCENLGAALARSPCGKIRRALQDVTCEAIKDPSKDVVCSLTTDPNDECAAIQQLRENPDCPSLVEFLEYVDKIGGGTPGRGGPPGGGGSAKGTGPGSPRGQGRRVISPQGSLDSQGNKRPVSAPGGSSVVDAATIHEISTKVQSCLQHARAIAAKMGSADGGGGGGSVDCRKTMRVQCKNAGSSKGGPQTVKVNSKVVLNTKGVTINDYNKVDKPFGRNPGIQVKMVDKQGNVEQFKKPYRELLTEDPSGAINICIRSPCKSTPGKLLCVSTKNNPCCSDSTTANTSSTQPTSSSQKPAKVTIQGVEESETTEEDEDPTDNNAGSCSQDCPSSQEGPSSQDYPTQSSRKPGKKDGGAVVVYKRSPKQKGPKDQKNTKGAECSPSCTNCKRRTCPTSKHYRGGGGGTPQGGCLRKKGCKLQVYNVTTSHFSQAAKLFRTPYIKGMPIVDSRMYEQYTHPDRYRAGENYMKRRREMIQKIKGKCPWM